MRQLLEYAAERAARYLESLDKRSVAPSPEAIANLGQLQGSMPQAPGDAMETLRLLDEVCSPATMAMAGPRFFGFVIGGSLPVTLAANWLAGAWDQNSAFHAVTPATAELEQIALELARRPLRTSRWHWRRVRHRRHGGELLRSGRGPPRRPREGRLGRGGKRALWRAAHIRRRW